MARRLKAQYQIQVKRIQVDGGSELLGSEEGELWQELISDGVFVIISAPYYPEMNGIAERSNRVIIEMARCWDTGMHHIRQYSQRPPNQQP